MNLHNKLFKRVVFSVIILAFYATTAVTVTAIHDLASQPPCTDCHVCATPTVKNPCLKNCLRSTGSSNGNGAHHSDEGPDISILGDVQDLYQPVRFDHKHHADMVGMGEGCTTCHHYSPEGKFPPCRECHDKPVSLGMPGLKGAFHRQCLSCHREWSHDTKCVVCHLPSEGELMSVESDSTDIMGISHPVVTVPDKKVYRTPYEPGPIVTLHHNEHVDLFGLSCVNCHQEENCSYCHDMEKETKIAKTDEEIHSICNDCHLNDKCNKCHDTVEKPAFSHTSTGWDLNRYHKSAGCRACHPTGKMIGKLSRECRACHSGWNQGNFDHAVAGMILDETHLELDCEDCHEETAYSKAPDCTACHDDDMNPRKTPPGEFLRY